MPKNTSVKILMMFSKSLRLYLHKFVESQTQIFECQVFFEKYQYNVCETCGLAGLCSDLARDI